MPGFVDSYQYDVFVSYAHVNNQSLVEGRSGWVTFLADKVKKRLDETLGRSNASRIWRDPKLSGNEVFSQELHDAVTNSATLLVMLSEAYLNSAWCRKERELFIDACGGEDEAMGRIFLVRCEEVAFADQPAWFNQILGYQFYEKDDVRGSTRRLGYPLPELTDREYWDRVSELCGDLAGKLKELGGQAKTTTPEATSSDPAASGVRPEASNEEEGDFGFQIEPSIFGDGPLPQEGSPLDDVPRYPIIRGPHYDAVRQTVRTDALTSLKENRQLWIAADWDVGRRGFVGSLMGDSPVGQKVPIFHLNCADVDSCDQLLDCFHHQFGMTIQHFGNWVASAGQATLVLENVGSTLANQAQGGTSLATLVDALLAFCPGSSVLMIGRNRPPADFRCPYVEILPFDQIDIREYLKHHPQHPTEIEDLELLDRLSIATGGIPRNLDSFVGILQFSSIDEAIASLTSDSSTNGDQQDELPPSLIAAVEKLYSATDDFHGRTFRLLSALCVLEYGEALKTIKRLYAKPFYEKHAIHLIDLSLLDAVQVGSTLTPVAQSKTSVETAPRILRSPRAVRDFVRNRISAEEHHDIVCAVANLLFGKNWRTGRIRTIKRNVQADSDAGLGNEYIVCTHLIHHAVATENCDDLSRATAIALNYVSQLQRKAQYRKGYLVAREFSTLLDDVDLEEFSLDEELAELRIVTAKCARMIGRSDKSVELLSDVLDSDLKRVKSRLADVHICMALAYDTMKDREKAIESARSLCEIAPAGSADHLQAEWILAKNEVSGLEQDRNLQQIESQARNKGHSTVADNITLQRAKSCSNSDQKRAFLDKIINGTGTDYNKLRAYLKRVDSLLDDGLGGEVGSLDRRWIERGYTYFFGQRMSSLFDECHRVLWRLYKSSGEIGGLLKLFRHSSFLWRLRGETQRELRYLKQLLLSDRTSVSDGSENRLRYETRYFDQRKTELVVEDDHSE